MIEALVFDLDGTIVQQAPDNRACSRAMSALYLEYGHHVAHEALYDKWTTSTVPLSSEEVWIEFEQPVGQPVGPDVRARLVPLMVELAVHGEPIRGDAGRRRDLKAARDMGMRIGLATGSSLEWARPALERNGLLHAFDCLSSAHDVERPKPAPDVYLAALRQLDAAPSRTVAFEDTAVGIAAAKAAGLRCVAVESAKEAHELSGADLRIASLASLPLARILSTVGASDG